MVYCGILKNLSLGNILRDSKTIEELFAENQEKIATIHEYDDYDYPMDEIFPTKGMVEKARKKFLEDNS